MKKWFKMILLIVVLISALGGCGVNQKDMSSQVWFITLKVNDSFLISFAEDKLGDEIRSSSYSNKEFISLEEQEQNTGKYIKVIYLGECDG